MTRHSSHIGKSSEILYIGDDLQLNTLTDRYTYLFGGGYCEFRPEVANADSVKYYYYTKDHLGNVRNVLTKNDNGQMEELQQTHYYPFGGIIADLSSGRDVQNRLYNGKELDTSNNLWWYDYGARQYDPTAPRFITPDPLAEKYYPWNYYTYCVGNPIIFVDQNGEFPTKWQADAARFIYKVTHPSKFVSPVIKNTDTSNNSYKYTFNSVAKNGENYELTAVHKLDKSFVQKTQDFGDATTLVGYSLILSVEGAEVGVPLAMAGEAISKVGAYGEMAVDLINGDIGDCCKNGLFLGANKLIEQGLKTCLPGFKARFGDEDFNIGTSIIEHGASLKESLMERTFDTALDKYEEKE